VDEVSSAVDVELLNREYNARAATTHFDKDAIYRERSRKALDVLERVPDRVYDERSGSKLDVFPAGQGAPVFAWIHGGYWRSSSKEENAFVAPGLVQQGITVVNIDYSLAPAVSLDEIVRQIRSSVAWIYRNLARYGADPRRIHIGGHSAGGHLTGMVACSGWHSSYDLPEDVVGAALCVSGLFELEPLRHTFVNDNLLLDPAVAARNSPLLHIPERSTTRLLATCGGDESSEFRRQTDSYLSKWKKVWNAGEGVAMPGFHHFDIILELERSGNPLFDTLVRAISED
jgi:arylformamidase